MLGCPVHPWTANERLNYVLVACQPLSNFAISCASLPVVGEMHTDAFNARAGQRSMTPAQDSDRQIDVQLRARIAAGDEIAFGALYDRFSPGLYSFVLKLT